MKTQTQYVRNSKDVKNPPYMIDVHELYEMSASAIVAHFDAVSRKNSTIHKIIKHVPERWDARRGYWTRPKLYKRYRCPKRC